MNTLNTLEKHRLTGNEYWKYRYACYRRKHQRVAKNLPDRIRSRQFIATLSSCH
jgi:hypothetical protein